MMRRYSQGSLDFACGMYAVINALCCLYTPGLAEARRLFQEAYLAVAGRPELFAAFVRNETDHYWLVRFMLGQACASSRYRPELVPPFSNCLLPGNPEQDPLDPGRIRLYLPEKEEPRGPASFHAALREADSVWQALSDWFMPAAARSERRAAILRFHRFLPGVAQPVVSHWTTGRDLVGNTLFLHDASPESGALLEIDRQSLTTEVRPRGQVRIVPESLLLLRACPCPCP